MSDSELCTLSATELAERIRTRAVSAREVVDAHLARIEAVNPQVNALVTLCPHEARQRADALDQALVRDGPVGPLHGVPVGIKDFHLTRGMRTTFGSPIYRDLVPDVDHLPVERLRAAGAVVVGKTNTPEFAAGAQTFNEVFGVTRNPYDPARTCGGSSGGAAVALACGMLPLADGSDLGGSLRNPAAYCNVVGFRTSPGRVPIWPSKDGWESLFVMGPMARTVRDVALMLSAMAGPDERVPLSISDPGEAFRGSLERDFRGVRVAWSRDLGGFPVEPAITQVTDAQRGVFEQLGCTVEDADPDVHDATEIFQTLRAHLFALEHGEELRQHRALIKDTVVWNTEKGLALDAPTVGGAQAARTALYHRVRSFMERYEFLVLPVNSVPPIPVDVPYPTEIAGRKLTTYMDWMALCYAITLTGLPAIAVPCGFTPEGWPCGLQIVGRYRQEASVLQLAHAFEQATGFGQRRPPLAEAAAS